MFTKLDSLTVEDADLRPATAAEMEEVRRKLRRRHLQVRAPDGTLVPISQVRAPAPRTPTKGPKPKQGK